MLRLQAELPQIDGRNFNDEPHRQFGSAIDNA
jgi:hypothetical protein